MPIRSGTDSAARRKSAAGSQSVCLRKYCCHPTYVVLDVSLALQRNETKSLIQGKLQQRTGKAVERRRLIIVGVVTSHDPMKWRTAIRRAWCEPIGNPINNPVRDRDHECRPPGRQGCSEFDNGHRVGRRSTALGLAERRYTKGKGTRPVPPLGRESQPRWACPSPGQSGCHPGWRNLVRARNLHNFLRRDRGLDSGRLRVESADRARNLHRLFEPRDLQLEMENRSLA